MKRRIRKGGVLNIKSKMWYLGACGVLVAAGMGGLGAVNEASAVLEYSSAAGVNFTISPSITVTVSGDLLIDELAPGNYSDSNIITVGVATNTMAGYHLSATAGTASTNTRLTNADDSNYYFGNLSGNVSTLAGFNDNTWGYAYSTDSGSTWVSGDADSASAGYNGLPLDNNDEGATGVTLIDTSTTADSRTVKFKIGAKASNVQASGTYNNTVNFYAVAYDAPVGLADAYASAGKTMHNGYYKMQDMSTAICGAVDVVPSELQVIDVRDDNVYWITKLADGHCWMTQNLDLNLSTSTALTSEDTNLKVASGNGYSTGYSESGGVITYTPSMATTNSWEGSNRNNFSDWDDTDGIQDKMPKSWDTGLYYEDGTYFTSSSCNYLAGTANPCARFSETPFTTNGTHGAVGNLYNFTQAIASNDSTNLASNTSGNPASDSPKNSICPKGWRLPYVSSQSGSVSGSTNEFARLNYLYNGDKTGTGLTDGDQGLFTAPLYFVRSGDVRSDALNGMASGGYYWSSTVYSSTNSYVLSFNSSSVNPAGSGSRAYGFAVRCVAE